MREIKLKPDGAWHLTREEVDWLNGAADREAALLAQVEELTRENELLKKDLDPNEPSLGQELKRAETKIEELTRELAEWESENAPAQAYERLAHRRLLELKQAEARLAEAHQIHAEQYEVHRQDAAKLAAVVEAARKHLDAIGHDPDEPFAEPCDVGPDCTLCGLSTALAAAREQPTHAFPCCCHCQHGISTDEVCDRCAREQPTQEKPEAEQA